MSSYYNSIENGLVITPKIEHICNTLELWNNIRSFFGMTIVENGAAYFTLINKFENDLIKFYEYEKDISLTGRIIEDNETFYFHCLHYYIPSIARECWDKLKLVWESLPYNAMNKEISNQGVP